MMDWHLFMPIAELMKLHPEKTSGDTTIACIVSDKYFDPGHILRLDFLKFLEIHAPDIALAIFGKGAYKFTQGRGPVASDGKHTAIFPFRYYFAVENSSERNYITEKLVEGILGEALTFYWGCPNVADHIDPRAYVILDLEHPEAALATIRKTLASDGHTAALPYIRAAKDTILRSSNMMAAVAASVAACAPSH